MLNGGSPVDQCLMQIACEGRASRNSDGRHIAKFEMRIGMDWRRAFPRSIKSLLTITPSWKI